MHHFGITLSVFVLLRWLISAGLTLLLVLVSLLPTRNIVVKPLLTGKGTARLIIAHVPPHTEAVAVTDTARSPTSALLSHAKRTPSNQPNQPTEPPTPFELNKPKEYSIPQQKLAQSTSIRSHVVEDKNSPQASTKIKPISDSATAAESISRVVEQAHDKQSEMSSNSSRSAALVFHSPKVLDPGFKLKMMPAIAYPAVAKRMQRGGWARLLLIITPEGRVKQVHSLKESAQWGFAHAAKHAYQQAIFTPPRVNQKKVWVRWQVTVQFRQ